MSLTRKGTLLMRGRKPILISTPEAVAILEISPRHFSRLRQFNPGCIAPAACNGSSYSWNKQQVIALKRQLKAGTLCTTPHNTMTCGI